MYHRVLLHQLSPWATYQYLDDINRALELLQRQIHSFDVMHYATLAKDLLIKIKSEHYIGEKLIVKSYTGEY